MPLSLAGRGWGFLITAEKALSSPNCASNFKYSLYVPTPGAKAGKLQTASFLLFQPSPGWLPQPMALTIDGSHGTGMVA